MRPVITVVNSESVLLLILVILVIFIQSIVDILICYPRCCVDAGASPLSMYHNIQVSMLLESGTEAGRMCGATTARQP